MIYLPRLILMQNMMISRIWLHTMAPLITLERFNVLTLLLLTLMLQINTLLAQSPGVASFDHYSQENGLSNNQVQCAYQDKVGWMWFGTNQGLNRFDGYTFTVFRHNDHNPGSIRGELVRDIFEDSKGTLWVGTEKAGLNRFDRRKEIFSHIALRDKAYSANSIQEDMQGRIWIGTDAGLYCMDTTGVVRHFANNSDNPSSLRSDFVRKILIDRQNNLWIGTEDGLDYMETATGVIRHIHLPDEQYPDDGIWSLCQGNDGTVWVGAYHTGIYIADPNELTIRKLAGYKGDERSMTVRAILQDRQGNYWIGTRGGLYIYHSQTGGIFAFKHDDSNPFSLIQSSIHSMFLDAKGDVWIGTRGGISHWVNEKQSFRYFAARPNDHRYLNNAEIYAFWTAPDGNIWIGTEDGGVNILDRQKNTFQYLTVENSGLSTNCIKSFLPFGEQVWVGTFMKGVNVMDVKQKRVVKQYRHLANDPSSIIDDRVWSMFRDSKGRIWVGTDKGVDRFDQKTGQFIHYKHLFHNKTAWWIDEDAQGDLWIGGEDELVIFNPETDKITRHLEKVRSLCPADSGLYWVAIRGRGIALYDKNKGALQYFTEREGIANNIAWSTLKDEEGYIWVSTANGLSRFDPRSRTFINYYQVDGLQNGQFNYGAFCKLLSGEMIFGGLDGVSMFNPLKIQQNDYVPPVVFTDFRISNQSVPIDSGKNAVLEESITLAQQVRLNYRQNMFTIEFAALNYAKSEKNQYAYRLEGFEDQWIYGDRTATYTNLDPGKYLFRVRASNCDGLWNNEGAFLIIQVLPPYWKTWWFRTLLFLAVCGAVFAIANFFVGRANLRNELFLEKTKARELHKIDMLKLQFFTNISHDIRTPLTLIIGPVEQLIQDEHTLPETRSRLEPVQRNARLLLRLINQLLDFRKLESGKYELEYSQGDIVRFLQDLVSAFSYMSAEKKIALSFTSNKAEYTTMMDAGKLEKVVNNLLSNAFKFTREGGKIDVLLNVTDKDIEISVKDTGIGIPAEHVQQIFSRFFRSGNADQMAGTGIGLAIANDFAKLMNGELEVNSEEGVGSTFVFRFPQVQPVEVQVTDLPELENGEIPFETTDEMHRLPLKYLLVVDDTVDMRKFICDSFRHEFHVLGASSGKQGFELATKYIPDIIISDLLMPGMSGEELCRKLKKDERTSHIPIILLTAVSSKSSELQGLMAGADDYMTKPFDVNILKAKVDNLLSLRDTLRGKFTQEMILQPTQVTVSSADERFLRRAMEVVEAHIDDPALDIEKFAAEVGVSRMQLYRKFEALTSMTVKEFIRSIRLKRAAQLLEQGNMSISEVAYAVGFSDLAHFRKCFKESFGVTPSDYKKSDE